jgi:hypothetical protein
MGGGRGMNKQTKQKPVAYVHLEKWLDGQLWPEDAFSEILFEGMTPLYTAPPKREWVGLTRAERFEIEKAMSKYYDYQHECKTVCLPEFAAAIEAKLREKNMEEIR